MRQVGCGEGVMAKRSRSGAVYGRQNAAGRGLHGHPSGKLGGTDGRVLSSVNLLVLARVDRPQKAMVCPTYRVDSRGTRMGSINIVLAGRLRLETMDLSSMSGACRPMAVLLWSMVESGTRSRSE